MISEYINKFWEEQFAFDQEQDEHVVAIIDGSHYVIGDENSKEKYFRGFGGARFEIKFNDGTVVQTTNLWYQGDIPTEWQDIFPNNAKFVEGYRWKKIGNCSYLVK